MKLVIGLKVGFLIFLCVRTRHLQKTNAGLKLTVLLQDEDCLIFSPNFKKIQHEILRMIDGIVRSVQTFARIDSIIIPSAVGAPESLKVRRN